MKRRFSVVALVLTCILLVSGCGTDTPTTPDVDGDAVSIVYWSMWESTEPQGQAIREAVDAYMADTGNVVDLQFKGRTGIREGLEPALVGGMTIDLFDEDIDRVNITWGDYLMDLEDLAAASDYEATANAGLIAACREVGGGRLKSIPYQPFVFAWFYNQDIFDEAGVTGVPKTWDEFLDVCAKVKDAGYIPITCDDAYIDTMIGYALARYIGEEGVTDVVLNGKWAEEPAVLKAAQKYEELASLGYFSPNIASNIWPAGQNGELALGEVAMYLNGSWLPNEVRDIAGPDFRWGCFSYPAVEGGKDGVEAANFGAQVLGINKGSEVAEEAFEIIRYITQGEYDALLSEMSLGIPADNRNTEWPEVIVAVKPVMDSLELRYSWAANVQANVDITPLLKENFTKLCAGGITAQEFVDAMQSAY